MELVAQVGALGSRAAHRGGDQGGLEAWVALAGAATLLLAGAFVVGRAQPRPGGETLSGAEDGHVRPDLGDNGRRRHASTPGMVTSKACWAAKGRMAAPMAASTSAKHRTAKRLVRRLDALGYAVMLRPKPAN